MIFTIAASQIADAAFSDHFSRACASDCRTGMVVIPDPPPSAMSVGKDGNGDRFATSSSASNSGGSRRAPGLRAARRRAASTTSSMSAATSGAELFAPAAVASR